MKHTRRRPVIVAAAATALLLVFSLKPTGASATTASPIWLQLHPSTSPPALYGAAMAYDAATGQLILFGGEDQSGYLNGTWEWDGSNWSRLNPATSPPGRVGASMAYDYSTGQLILFGGANTSGALDDTWEWTGSNWQKLSPAKSPPALAYAPMSWAGQLILTGGAGTAGNPLSGTWAFAGPSQGGGATGTWWQPSSGPSALYGASTTFNYYGLGGPGRQLILFGGRDNSGYISSTQQWACSLGSCYWGGLSATTSPPARYGASMTNFAWPPGNTSAAYSQSVLADSPSAFWKLDETSGTTAADSSGNGHPGAYSGSYELGAARAPDGSPAVDFTGGEVKTDLVQSGATSYSIEAWVKPTSADMKSGNSYAIVSDRGSGAGQSVTLSLGGPGSRAGTFCIGADTNNAYVGDCTTATYPPGYWYYVAGTWSGTSGQAVSPSQFHLYVDAQPIPGSPIAIGSFTAPLTGLGGTRLAGTETWSPYTGDMADVAVYTSALSHSAVLEHWGAVYRSEDVLFGGVGTSGYLGDTWTWHPFEATWSELSSPESPSSRYEAAMAFDPVVDELVLFGGTGPNGALDDTWVWKVPKWRPS